MFSLFFLILLGFLTQESFQTLSFKSFGYSSKEAQIQDFSGNKYFSEYKTSLSFPYKDDYTSFRNELPSPYYMGPFQPERRIMNSKLMNIDALPENLWKTISLNNKPTGNYVVAPSLNSPIDLEKQIETEYNELKRNSFQLTDDVRPLHYFLTIKAYYWGNGTFEGKMRVVLKVEQETSFITLHYNELSFVNESIQIVPNTPREKISLKTIRFFPEEQIVMLVIEPKLSRGRTYNLTMQYSGEILSGFSFGISRTSYFHKGEERHMVTTQFQTAFARRAFPCLDEPRFKSRFSIQLLRPSNATAVSNMPKTSSESGPDGWVWDSFAATPRMPTYIVAFMIFDFEHHSAKGPGCEFKVWAMPGNLHKVSHILNSLTAMFYFLQHKFGVRYPLPKIDLVAIPTNVPIAMENWGLISVQEEGMLKSTDVKTTIYMQRMLGHELVHMWFGNLVTPTSWLDIWLSEGMAVFLANKAAALTLPQVSMPQNLIFSENQLSLLHDVGMEPQLLMQPTAVGQSAFTLFNRGLYAKSSAVVTMVENFLPPEVFYPTLTKFLKRRKFSNSSNSDFLEMFGSVAHLDGNVSVREVMWDYLNTGGYPVIDVTSLNRTHINISQERFRYIEENHKRQFWWIPFSTEVFGTNYSHVEPSQVFWMKPQPSDVFPRPDVTSSECFVLNGKRQGYYRVNYDEDNWRRIAAVLKKDHTVIPATARMRIVDDVFHLYLAGAVTREVFVDVITYGREEKEPYVLESLFRNMNIVPQKHHPKDLEFKKHFLMRLLVDLF